MFDLLTNKTVQDLSVVPENLRGLYQKTDDGTYVQRSEDAGVASAIAAITGLSGALKASRTEADSLRSNVPDLSPLGEYGKTPQEIAEKVAQTIKDLQTKGGETAQMIERVKAEMHQAHQKVLSEREKQIEALNGQLHGQLVDAEINKAAAEKGVDPDLIRPFITPTIKVVADANGQLKPVVMEPDGKLVRYSQVNAGQEMGVAEAVTEMLAQDKFKPLVPSKAPVGGGASPSQRQVQRPGAAPKSAVDKISAGIKKLG